MTLNYKSIGLNSICKICQNDDLQYLAGVENIRTFSLHAAYGESDSLQKNRTVFVPAFNKCSPGKPWVWEM